MDKLHKFYCSKPWRDLSYGLKIQANGKCNRCNKNVLDFKYLIAHHKTELTEDNVDDTNISLNPDNIEIICHDCHNHEHRRFGYKKKVYLVYGSPLSGKTTLVRELMQYGDIVLDMDEIWQALSFQDEYIKPDNLRFNVFKMRDDLLDQIKTRYGNFYDAYIIGGYPDKYERERVAERLGAELIYCESTKEECIERLENSNKPSSWLQYINDWWEEYGE
ncbi:MAG TPA: HNH endonuclease [Tissierellaceae bacterium]|nr:HNH endonuclease [Tissierellaceae bacterium]